MESSIQLPPDGVGTHRLRTQGLTVGSVIVEQEVVSLADPDGTLIYPSLLAKDSTLGANFGADGAGPPSIPGSGVRGWLRAIYDRLAAGLTVSGTVSVSNPTANPETGLAKDATLTTRLPAALDGDGGVKTHVNNFPATQPVTGPLTDSQLRASPVPVGGFPADQLVHAANLDLAVTALRDALRGASAKTLTDVAAALAATLTVAGTVTVANPTAGPNTDQLVHGTVTANLGTIDGAATEATLAYTKNKFAPDLRTTAAVTVNTVGDNIIRTPGSGKRVRVHWIGMSSSQNNSGENKVTVKFAAAGTAKYIWRMGNPGAFSHWEPITGAVDEAFIVNLTTADPVDVNYTLEEV